MIEAGEYVRIKEGIFKVISIDELYIYLDKLYFDKQYQTMRNVTFKEKIVKHSKNIIDLIEVYDYVNGMIVFDIITYDNGEKTIKISSGYLMGENEMQDILTHEQYKENCYTVERKEKC